MKDIIISILKVLLYPYYLWYRLKVTYTSERKAILGLTQFISLLPGFLGNCIRVAAYSHIFDKVEQGCTISFGVTFATPKISIGKNVYIGPYSEIGQSIISDNVQIGSKVCILSGLKQHSLKKIDNEITLGVGKYYTILIGKNSWIGTGAIIGANIGQNSIIGAGSVVVCDIEDNVVAAGNPAKKIRNSL